MTQKQVTFEFDNSLVLADDSNTWTHTVRPETHSSLTCFTPSPQLQYEDTNHTAYELDASVGLPFFTSPESYKVSARIERMLEPAESIPDDAENAFFGAHNTFLPPFLPDWSCQQLGERAQVNYVSEFGIIQASHINSLPHASVMATGIHLPSELNTCNDLGGADCPSPDSSWRFRTSFWNECETSPISSTAAAIISSTKNVSKGKETGSPAKLSRIKSLERQSKKCPRRRPKLLKANSAETGQYKQLSCDHGEYKAAEHQIKSGASQSAQSLGQLLFDTTFEELQGPFELTASEPRSQQLPSASVQHSHFSTFGEEPLQACENSVTIGARTEPFELESSKSADAHQRSSGRHVRETRSRFAGFLADEESKTHIAATPRVSCCSNAQAVDTTNSSETTSSEHKANSGSSVKDPLIRPGKRSSGCWTCRMRRKRCDEARPACENCRHLNVQCAGYSLKRPDFMRGQVATQAYLKKIRQKKRASK